MTRATNLLKSQNEGAQRRTLAEQLAYVVDLLNDMESGIKGENGSKDRPHPDARKILGELSALKRQAENMAKAYKGDKTELWFRRG